MKRRPGNRIEGTTGCPSRCRPLRPLIHFLDDISYPQSVEVIQFFCSSYPLKTRVNCKVEGREGGRCVQQPLVAHQCNPQTLRFRSHRRSRHPRNKHISRILGHCNDPALTFCPVCGRGISSRSMVKYCFENEKQQVLGCGNVRKSY